MGLLLLGGSGCSDVIGSSASEGIEVRVMTDGVSISNARMDSISYVVMDSGVAARALLSPCLGVKCPWILPENLEWVSSEDVLEWRNTDTLIVYWWHAVLSDEERYQTDSIRAVVVDY